MPTFHPTLVDFLRAHHGIVSTLDLHRLGITGGELRALLESGEFVRVYEGVYRHVLWPDTLESRCAAACAADPTVVICANGTPIHPDLGDPSIGFYVEIDHPEWHLGTDAAGYDDRRDRQVRLAGGWVERVWTNEVDPIRPGLIGELLTAHRRQREVWTHRRTASV